MTNVIRLPALRSVWGAFRFRRALRGWRGALAVAAPLLATWAQAADLRAVTAEFAPYTMARRGGSGVILDAVRQAATAAGLEIAFEFHPWARAQMIARRGDDVLILPLTRTPTREPDFTWISPILADPMIFAIAKRTVDATSIDDLRHLQIGVQAKSPGERLLRLHRFTAVEPVANEATNARKLINGRLDGWFVRLMVADWTLRDAGGRLSDFARGPTVETPPMYLAASRGLDPDIIARLARALAAVDRLHAESRRPQSKSRGR